MQQTNTENWTEIISPKTNPFDLRLADVWRYKDLLMQLVKRDFYAQYRQTILGPLWHLIQPALTTFMFFVVFNKIANIPTGSLPASLFYMCSITIWNYFSSCFTSTSATFTTNASLFGKVYFPRLVMPLSSVVSNIIRFGIQLLLLIAFIIYHQAAGTYHFHFGF
ncbi:MAG TPA: ABC transporter permease, partial [Chitinophagaceae bacterium]|nr:ABC transporter permease [Chitinophagaceae bacterium]